MRGGGYGKEACGGFVDANVGGLGGQDDGNQELEWTGIVQFCCGFRVWALLAAVERIDGGFFHAAAGSSEAERAF